MPIDPLGPSESGPSSRGKLNAAIDKANLVDEKADLTQLASTDTAVLALQNGKADKTQLDSTDAQVALRATKAELAAAKKGVLEPLRLNTLVVLRGLLTMMTESGQIFERILPRGVREAWETRATYRLFAAGIEHVRSAGAGYIRQVMSDDGDIVAVLRRDGSHRFGAAAIDNAPRIGALHAFAPPGTLKQILDLDGNIGFRIDSEGRVNGESDAVVQQRAARLLASTALIIIWGQSLSYGVQSLPALSTTQKFNAQMFVGGRRPHEVGDDAAAYASLVPLIESDAVSYGETPASGMAEMLRQLLIAENGLTLAAHEWAPLVVTPGEGSTAIDDLDKGSALYNARVPIVLTKAYERAQELGKGAYVPVLPFIQGERDIAIGTAPATYKSKLAGLQTDFEGDANTTFGANQTIPLILSQTVSHHAYAVTDPLIAQAQLEVARSNPKVLMVCPPYFLDFQADNTHLTDTSSRVLGAYLGLAAKRSVVDGATWQHLDIDAAGILRQGKVLTVPFKGVVGSLVIDTTRVAAATNYGFSLVDGSGTPITISSVTVTQPNVITIVATSSVPAGAKLRAGWNGTGSNSGRLLGPRTNIRDRAGDALVFDPGGIAFPMHNWLPLQENVLS